MTRRTTNRRRIAIIGAGPTGLESALYASRLGHDVIVFEKDTVGENVRRWGFVELITPWSLNVSTLGLDALQESGLEPPSLEEIPSGNELVERYLLPLARGLEAEVREREEVIGIARQGLLKNESIAATGDDSRENREFRILSRRLDGAASVEIETFADVVIDATGVYGQHASLGDGGVAAMGETSQADRIDYQIPDVLGAQRERFAGRTTLLVGAGHSAMTALDHLVQLAGDAEGTEVLWARRDEREPPAQRISDDPLEARDRLARRANEIAAAPPQGVRVLSGVTVSRVAERGPRLRVDLRATDGSTVEPVEVDRVVALVGYRPDLSFTRELHVHSCYASEGPMKLAASLLGSGGGDCLASTSAGPEVLLGPEPGFFVVGHKSYGRRSDFLLRVGREQVRDVFRWIEKDEDLDLYQEAANR